MTDVTVDLAGLAGFELDLRDMGVGFVSNASRYLPVTALPAGTPGLMGTLATPLEKFRSTVSTAMQAGRTAIDTFGTNLATAALGYRSTDDGTANAALAATAPLGTSGAPASSGEQGDNRFGGLQLPSLPDVPELQNTIRQVGRTPSVHRPLLSRWESEQGGSLPPSGSDPCRSELRRPAASRSYRAHSPSAGIRHPDFCPGQAGIAPTKPPSMIRSWPLM